ncbi:DUF3253 domain-containing protein [Kineococcus indalonis]|uniref:DUF3253 domain-containing protein n=1 Tax=Kineococcus indalonis TaxID=2696566 RepID=UPI0014130C37|nr:DUF2256 and DUF3253 domain-containing protein [Kineococcus indalonis]NAZ86112.1 DUF3253 domain-containing protein [Kineococcus indalonis]
MAHRTRSTPGARGTEPPAKDCAVCGRTITWRRAWARDWEQVRYCSDACRRRARGAGAAVDARLEEVLRELLAARPAAAGVDPEEAARAVGGEGWRELVQPARSAARRLVAAGEAHLVQGGRAVDPSTARGPVRLRRR